MKRLLFSVLSVTIALLISSLVVLCIGENPINVLTILARATFGSDASIGYTIYYATPLIFTGLAVGFAFRAGLFNIGAEGQLYVGSFCAALVGLYAPEGQTTSAFWVSVAILASALGGMLWAFIPAFLRAWRGSHEVINTIMMNFISAALLGYLVMYHFKDPGTISINTPEISAQTHLPSLFKLGWISDPSPANLSFALAILATIVYGYVLEKTPWGFKLCIVGENPEAAKHNGIPVKKVLFWSLMISGLFSGLVGANDILGHHHRYMDDFSHGYGFLGIAVALLGRNHPVGIFLSAFLFGALHNAGLALEFDTENISRDLVGVIQGTVILVAASDYVFQRIIQKFKRKPTWNS